MAVKIIDPFKESLVCSYDGQLILFQGAFNRMSRFTDSYLPAVSSITESRTEYLYLAESDRFESVG